MKLLQALLLMILTVSLNGAVIASYDFTTNADPSTELANTSSSAVAGSGWTSGATASSGRSSSSLSFFGRGPSQVTGNSFIEFTVDANASYALSLTSLAFDYHISQIEGASTSFSFEVRSSVNAFASAIPGVYSTNPVTSASGVPAGESASFDLSGGSFDGLSSITFRLYATGNGNPHFNDIARWDNIQVEGVVASIPEPGMPLITLTGSLLLFLRRRVQRV